MNGTMSLHTNKLHFLKADYKRPQMSSLLDTADFRALFMVNIN